MTKKKWNQNSAIRGAIRRVFSRSPIIKEILFEGRREVPRFNKDQTRSKKNAVEYQCQVCYRWVPSTKISVDHIVPVISIEDGFIDWNTFVDRLFCEKSNLQRICEECHDKKTAHEKTKRLIIKYNQELNEIENNINIEINNKKLDLNKLKNFIKLLNKYILKKKVKSLESISNRAQEIKQKLMLIQKEIKCPREKKKI